MIRFAIPNRVSERERRVPLTPSAVAGLVERGHQVFVEHGAGVGSGFEDGEYLAAGAEVADRHIVVSSDGVVAMIGGPQSEFGGGRLDQTGQATGALLSLLTDRHWVIGLHDPLWRPEEAAKLAATGATVFALVLMPRFTRAQRMDVLSSMATVAGYQAALLAATRLPKMMPLMMTAAGTVPAAKVVVVGAGVAGLQAIATSRRLGAVVEGYDIRPAATEQIRSLGARAIEADAPTGSMALAASAEDAGGYARQQDETITQAQHDLLAPHVAGADAVITTAAIPGAASPVLVTRSMVEAMRTGSVIVDLAAERGGNCELSIADEEVDHRGIHVLAPSDLPSRSPATSSRLYASNLLAFIDHLSDDGALRIDRDDEITAETLVGIGGQIVQPRVAAALADPDPDRQRQRQRRRRP